MAERRRAERQLVARFKPPPARLKGGCSQYLKARKKTRRFCARVEKEERRSRCGYKGADGGEDVKQEVGVGCQSRSRVGRREAWRRRGRGISDTWLSTDWLQERTLLDDVQINSPAATHKHAHGRACFKPGPGSILQARRRSSKQH